MSSKKLDNESEALKAYRLCEEQIKLRQEATDEFEDIIRKLEQKIKKLGQYPDKLSQSQQQFIIGLGQIKGDVPGLARMSQGLFEIITRLLIITVAKILPA